MRSLVPTKGNVVRNGPHLTSRPFPWETDQLLGRLMNDFWGGSLAPVAKAEGAPLEIVETDEAIRVSVEVPGIDPQELEVSLMGQVLTLAAEKRDEHLEGDHQRTYSERQFGSFRRSIKLPCAVDSDDVKAEHRFGVVTITLRKSEAVRPRRIQVDIA